MDNKLSVSVWFLPKLPKALSKPQCHGTKAANSSTMNLHTITAHRYTLLWFVQFVFGALGSNFCFVRAKIARSREVAPFWTEKTCGCVFWKKFALLRKLWKGTCACMREAYNSCKSSIEKCLIQGTIHNLVHSFLWSFLWLARHVTKCQQYHVPDTGPCIVGPRN